MGHLCQCAKTETCVGPQTVPVFAPASLYLHNPVSRPFQTTSQGALLPPACVIDIPQCSHSTFCYRSANEMTQDQLIAYSMQESSHLNGTA